MITGLRDKIHKYLPKTHLFFLAENGMMEIGGIHLMDIGKVLVNQFLLGILIRSTPQPLLIYRIDLTTPKSHHI